MTNLEYLRTLSAEELAEWIFNERVIIQRRYNHSYLGLLQWLKETRAEKTEPSGKPYEIEQSSSCKTEPQMREATVEERQSVRDYIDSISVVDDWYANFKNGYIKGYQDARRGIAPMYAEAYKIAEQTEPSNSEKPNNCEPQTDCSWVNPTNDTK